jgi:uncharacterized glyoxalase superfamily protein PhnB
MTNSQTIRVTTIPAIRYANADQAIDWLTRVLGFTPKAVYRENGNVAHAELVLGNGMVMLGTFGHNKQTAGWFVEPSAVGGTTASVYLTVPACDPVYDAAKAAGAEILEDLDEKPYGGKAFVVRDPEGHIWSIGEYDPWSTDSSN